MTDYPTFAPPTLAHASPYTRTFIVRCALALVVVGGLCRCEPPPPPPNVLFILTDDQGIGDLSLHENDSVRTPHMDHLLTSGAKFERFYVSPVCAPTRASFLSGQYHPRTGAVFVTRRRETMAASVVTLPEYLKRAGYVTGLFGKWHNGATKPYDPAGQGFDEFLGFSLGHFNDYFNGELENERNEVVPFAGDLTDILTDTAAHFMTNAERPFFAMLTYQAPHTPVQVADDHWAAVRARGLTDYNTGIYAMVESIDEQIGRLLATLEAAGKLNNTIVVFSTDNGPNGDRYRMGLKGTKGQVNEGSVRVPFVIRLPGDHPANGRRFARPAAHIDLLPTLLAAVGQPVPPGLDGENLLPLLNARPGSEPRLRDRYVYVFKQGYDFTGYPGSVRDERYLLVVRGPERTEFYDLATDPGQRTDLTRTADWAGSPGAAVADTMLAAYRAKIRAVAPDPALIAPPIDLAATAGPVRLQAHEGEPRGGTHFNDAYGWANDWFADLDTLGGAWPIVTDATRRYRARVHYTNTGNDAVSVRLGTDGGGVVRAELPPAAHVELPVADRTPRKEVFPVRWATVEVEGLTVPAGATRLYVAGDGGAGVAVKEVTLLREE